MGGEFNIGSIQVSDQYINIHTHNMSPSHRNGFNVLNLPLKDFRRNIRRNNPTW